MLLFLVFLCSSSVVISYTILPTLTVDKTGAGEDALTIADQPAINLSAIKPVIIPVEDSVSDPVDKGTNADSDTQPETPKSPAGPNIQLPIPNAKNVDKSNYLQYSSPHNGAKSISPPVKYSGRDGDNFVDYDDTLSSPIDIFHQNIF